jgi:hypothetical protein
MLLKLSFMDYVIGGLVAIGGATVGIVIARAVVWVVESI